MWEIRGAQFCGAAAGVNFACWLAPSVTHGASGAMGPAYPGTLVSLAFQGESSRLCSRGSVELQVPMYAGKQDLPLSEH
jgi:hypothetical protein